MGGQHQLPQRRPRRSAGIELPKAAWSQGESAQQRSKESGGRLRRGSELGAIHRLAIVRRSPRSSANWKASAAEWRRRARKHLSDAMQPPRTEVPRLWQQGSVPDWVRKAEPYVEDPLVDAAVPMSQRRAFLELEDRTCRWPIGDPRSPDFLFCGATTREGKPYCAAHWARAYRPRAQATQALRRERASSYSSLRTPDKAIAAR